MIQGLIPLAHGPLNLPEQLSKVTRLNSVCTAAREAVPRHRLPPRAVYITVPATHNHGAFSCPSFFRQRGPQKSTFSRKPSQTAAGSSPKSSHSSTPHTPRPINHSSLKSHRHNVIWAVLGLTDDTAGIKQKVSFRNNFI